MGTRVQINQFQQWVRKRISDVIAPFMQWLNTKRFGRIAPVKKNIYIKPDDIYGWYRGNRYDQITYPGQIKGGDWSSRITKKEQIIKRSRKHKAINQRYKNGKKWMETRLFRERYRDDLKKGKKIHGINNLKELESYYEERYDSLFEKIKEHGMLPASEDNPNIAPIYVNIDKDGELLYTVDGNHRFAICKILGIKKMPVRVWMRHKEWQEKRNVILSQNHSVKCQKLLHQFMNHPDIVSELDEAYLTRLEGLNVFSERN